MTGNPKGDGDPKGDGNPEVVGDPLLVEEIDVGRAPGFDTGEVSVDDLSPGINIVHGPNASGKTTLARAMQWLLWPEDVPDRTSLTGRLSLDGEAWRVAVDPGGASYRRNGRETNGPNLPPADQRDRYHLALHDLLQQDTRNETFARTIERESAGGYDLAAAHEELGFSASPSDRRLSEVGRVEQAMEDWREANADVRGLRDEQHRLATLRGDLEEARNARERVERLDQAIEYAEARRDLDAARATVEEFPDVLADLAGDEADDVEDIESRIDEWKEKKADAEDRVSAAREDLADADLPDGGVQRGTIDHLVELRDEFDSLTDGKRRCEASLREAERRRENARSDLPLDVEEDDLVDLDPDVWEDVSEFARDAEHVRAEREIQNEVERWLDGGRPDTDLSTVERGSTALEHWLAHAEATDDGGGDTFRIAITSAVLLAVAGGMLAVLVHPALLVFGVLAVGIAWYGYGTRDRSGPTDARATYRATVEDLGIDEPGSWSESDVREHLTELYDELAAHRVAEQRDQLRETLATDVDDLAAKEQSLEERRETLRNRLGVAPDTTDVQILVLVEGVLRWQENHDRVLGHRERIETVDSQIESVRGRLREQLAPYGYDHVSDVAEARAHIRDLDDRQSTYEEAIRVIDRAEETVAEAEDAIGTLESEREEIFGRAGLTPGQHGRLRELCGQVDDYRDAVGRRRAAEHLVETEKTKLEAYPTDEPDLEDRDAPDLRQEKRQLEAVAEGYDDLRTEITEIETKIEEAKQSNEVEGALAEKERALNALAARLEEDYDGVVGHVLTEHVRESTRESSRPAVFQAAGDLLTRITKGRYRLDLDGAADTFRAYDTVTERAYALEELSSGTRLQLLLSVRVAFVEHQEQGVRLPLVLDETLANSDDRKADVIIESMIELARDGRQVFYLTAQGDEVARWLAALEDREAVDHAVVDLADVRDLDGHVDVPDLDGVADVSPSPPAPDGHDHESYGTELGVPAFDPRRGAGRTHLWYVLDDVDLLYRLLDLGVERWGQLEHLLDRTDETVLADDPGAIAEIERNGAALRAFVDAWQRGRGERVDRQVLDDSGAVSETFIEDVTDLAENYGGEAERIVGALRAGEVDRFRRTKTDELEQYFEENGYIEPVDPLEPEEIRARVLHRLLSMGSSPDEASDRTDELISRLTRSSPAGGSSGNRAHAEPFRGGSDIIK